MMTYFLDSHLDPGEIHSTGGSTAARSGQRSDVHLIKEKLTIPACRGVMKRPRLHELLERSVTTFPATLISGRAGTGKTVLAASYTRALRHVAWYSVESADVEWNVFANYFAACILRSVKSKVNAHVLVPADADPSQAEIASFIVNVLAEAETELVHDPLLIVLDGIHHVFDAPWFGEFFGLLLSSLPENANLLLLCRSKPPNPLWRMRSKQQLNVIDEKVLAFDLKETVRLTSKFGLKRSDAERAHSATFGRVSQLLEFSRRLTIRA
jgi:LuxR family transcriptional regulator, maltose regulon positive regulatory protein